MVDIHIDTSRKIVVSVLSGIALSIVATIWSVFVRPQIVMADDLQTVSKSVQAVDAKIVAVDQKVDKVADTVSNLAVALADQRIETLQDRVRELDVKAKSRRLTPDEVYRLSDYRDKLEKAKQQRDDIERARR